MSYHGEHERVITALRGSGIAAAPAVPALIRHIWTKPQQYYAAPGKLAERKEPDEEVIRFLGELGSSAGEALTALREVQAVMRSRATEEREKEKQGNKDNDDTNDSSLEDEGYVGVAIKRILDAGQRS